MAASALIILQVRASPKVPEAVRGGTGARGAQQRELEIAIPPGPRLRDTVIQLKGLHKGYGDRLLVDKLTFSVPPAAIAVADRSPCLPALAIATASLGCLMREQQEQAYGTLAAAAALQGRTAPAADAASTVDGKVVEQPFQSHEVCAMLRGW